MRHELKTIDKYFGDVFDGVKKFEIRKNDRNFKVGDVLRLLEIKNGKKTGNLCDVEVIYMTDYEQKEGYVVLGIR